MQPLHAQFVYQFIVADDCSMSERIENRLHVVVDVTLTAIRCRQLDVDRQATNQCLSRSIAQRVNGLGTECLRLRRKISNLAAVSPISVDGRGPG